MLVVAGAGQAAASYAHGGLRGAGVAGGLPEVRMLLDEREVLLTTRPLQPLWGGPRPIRTFSPHIAGHAAPHQHR